MVPTQKTPELLVPERTFKYSEDQKSRATLTYYELEKFMVGNPDYTIKRAQDMGSTVSIYVTNSRGDLILDGKIKYKSYECKPNEIVGLEINTRSETFVKFFEEKQKIEVFTVLDVRAGAYLLSLHHITGTINRLNFQPTPYKGVHRVSITKFDDETLVGYIYGHSEKYPESVIVLTNEYSDRTKTFVK